MLQSSELVHEELVDVRGVIGAGEKLARGLSWLRLLQLLLLLLVGRWEVLVRALVSGCLGPLSLLGSKLLLLDELLLLELLLLG